jgi:hypothetical protein
MRFSELPVKEIQNLFESGQYKKVIQKISSLSLDDSEYNPKDIAVLLLYKAKSEHRQMTYLNAILTINKLIKYCEKSNSDTSYLLVAYALRGHIRLLANDKDSANKDLQVVFSKEKEDTLLKEDYFALGFAYDTYNQLTIANIYYMEAIKHEPTAELYYYLALTNHSMNYSENAYKYLTKALLINNKYYQAYLLRAVVAEKLGNSEEVFKNINAAIETCNDHQCAYTYRGSLYFENKKYNEARIDFEKAISLGSIGTTINDKLKQCYSKLNIIPKNYSFFNVNYNKVELFNIYSKSNNEQPKSIGFG